MKLKQKYLPWMVLGAGGLGIPLALTIHNLTPDDRGLLPAGHPAFILICMLTALVLGFLVYILKDVQGELPYRKAFPVSFLSLIGYAAGLVGFVSSSITVLSGETNVLSVLTGISGFLAALSMGLIGFFRYKKLRPHYLFHAVVTIHLLFLLIFRYQDWNTQPQLQLYFTQLLASLLLMITFYQRTAFDANIGNRRDYTFFGLATGFFCCLAIVSSDWLFYLGLGLWCFTNRCSLAKAKSLPSMELPEEVLYCMQTLSDAGHSVYVVGGCVRDHLLGLTPSDYDMCTSATPDEICDLFERHNLVRNGEKHGTIGVVVAGQLYEITTFRKEGAYSDARHPDEVEFVTDIREDLARRDFTVNAMAYAPEIGFVDPFGGQQDLEKKVLRAVGDPLVRFREDALRILRGVRFAVRFGLVAEEKTLEGMVACAPLMEQLAKERICTELSKLLPLINTQQLVQYQPIFLQLFPALGEEENTFRISATVVGLLPGDLPLRLAGLLHRIDNAVANELLLGLKLSNTLRNRASVLLQLQNAPLPADKKQLRHITGEQGAEVAGQLMALQLAIAKANDQDTEELETAQLLLRTICNDGGCLTVKDLAITGSDLLALGAKPGPGIGRCMQSLLSLVQEELLQNTKEELLDAAKNYFELEENTK